MAKQQPAAHGSRNQGAHNRRAAGTTRVAAPQQRRAQSASNGATRVADPQQRRGQSAPAGKGGSGGGKKKKSNAKAVWMNILKTLVVLGCIGVIVVSFLAVSVVKYVVESTADDDLMLDLMSLSQPQTGYIWAVDPETGEQVVYQKLTGVSNSIWVPLSSIPQDMIDAVISTEDREFYDHNGFRFWRTVYAGVNDVFHFRSSFGASTIDQQLVKNLTGEKEVVGADGDRTVGYKRKLREIFRAVGLNNVYSKDTILEAYLNTMPLSGSIVGVQAGAKEYFNKDVSELTLTECATIAGITNWPSKYNPYKNPEACLTRRNDVLYFMLKNKAITQEVFEEAVRQPLGLYEGERTVETAPKQVNSYFADAVMEAVVQDMLDSGMVSSREAAVFQYYNGGLNIYCTVDLRVQREMEQIYTLGYGEGGLFPAAVTAETTLKDADGNEYTATVHPQSAMVVMDYEGAVRGIVGGIGEKDADLVLNRATQSVRPIGSTMKPIGPYALAVDFGLVNYSSLLLDAPVASRNPSDPLRNPETGEIVFDWPYNYGENHARNEPILLCDAVARSTNTVAARVGEIVGVDTMFDFLEGTLQISSLVAEGATNDKNLAPLTLGSLTEGISPLELAAAYAIFGNGGDYHNPYFYTKVTDRDGNLLLEPGRYSITAVSPETSYAMNRLLSGPLRGAGATAGGMAPGYLDSVAKTGTTTDDKDRWFVGLTPYYVSAMWWGYDTNEQIVWPARASTNPPPVVWKAVMEAAQAGLPEKGFPEKPAGVVTAPFCRETGELAGPLCPNQQTGYYLQEFVPQDCTLHREGE